MNLLINLISIKSGGGQQVAINFIKQIIKQKNTYKAVYFIVTKGTEVYKYLSSYHPEGVILVKNNLIYRFYFTSIEVNSIIKKLKIDVIYTLFGVSINKKGAISIVGNAYSNLFFPEYDFWKEKKKLKQIYLKIRDKLRLNSSFKADAIIFENLSMQKRASILFNYPSERTIFIKPSISEIVQNLPTKDIINICNSFNKNKFKILLLTGYHKNKNLEILPNIANIFKVRDIHDVQFIISISETDKQIKHILNDISALGVFDYFNWIGIVNPLDVAYLYSSIETVLLLSQLESFSNNIIEAWIYKKPLIISDLEWATSICKKAAVYVQRDNYENIANAILRLKNDISYYNEIVALASDEVKTYPSPAEKVKLQLEFIKSVYACEKN